MTTITDYRIDCISRQASKIPTCDTDIVVDTIIVDGPPLPLSDGPTTGNTVALFMGDIDVQGLIDPTGVVFDEQTVRPATVDAGRGQVWVRDDVPCVLMFTDDDGTDFVLNGPGAITTLTSAGGTETLVNDGTGPTLAVKGLTAPSVNGTVLSSDAVQVNISASAGFLSSQTGRTVGDIFTGNNSFPIVSTSGYTFIVGTTNMFVTRIGRSFICSGSVFMNLNVFGIIYNTFTINLQGGGGFGDAGIVMANQTFDSIAGTGAGHTGLGPPTGVNTGSVALSANDALFENSALETQGTIVGVNFVYQYSFVATSQSATAV